MEYEAEGIELQNWKDIENSQTIDLFEGHLGLIDALNEQCTRPNGNSEVSNIASESTQLSFLFSLALTNKSSCAGFRFSCAEYS
jgi:myosin heavy subunit